MISFGIVMFFNSRQVGWDTGRPRRAHETTTAEKMIAVRLADDRKFINTKTQLPLPPVLYFDLRVCNGLDVHERAAFDHMWGFELANKGFSFNLNPEPVQSGSVDHGYEHFYLPYFVGVSLKFGGKPELLDNSNIMKLRNQRVYLHNIHYQSSTKLYIKYDVCRRLLSTAQLLSLKHTQHLDVEALRAKYGDFESTNRIAFLLDQIQNPTVREGCISAMNQKKSEWPNYAKFTDCINHEMDINAKPNCV